MTSDLYLFKHKQLLVLLILYINDILIAALITIVIYQIRDILKEFFKLKEFGKVQEFLSIMVVRNRQNH